MIVNNKDDPENSMRRCNTCKKWDFYSEFYDENTLICNYCQKKIKPLKEKLLEDAKQNLLKSFYKIKHEI